jgi:hypothetical protein
MAQRNDVSWLWKRELTAGSPSPAHGPRGLIARGIVSCERSTSWFALCSRLKGSCLFTHRQL